MNKHHLRATVTATAALLVACSLSACDSSAGTVASDDAQSSKVDAQTGSITFPLDQYGVSASEDEYITSAESVVMSLCAAKHGVDFRPTPPVSDIANTVSTYFGAWTESYTKKFGFVPPESDADLVANGVKGAPKVTLHGFPSLKHNGELTDADWDTVNACRDDSLDTGSLAPQGPWSKPGGAAVENALAGDAAKEVESDYDACLTSKGLTPDAANPGFVMGADVRTISPQQISLALQVVDCKTQVHYVQRLSALVDEAEAPIVAKYHKELVAQRQRIDAALVTAKKVIADYQHEHPEFK